MSDRSNSAAFHVDLPRFDLRIIRAMQSSGRDGARHDGWGAWQTSSQMVDRSNIAAPDVDLGRFDLRIVRAMQSSARQRPEG
jgi:hypothetical protein